MSGLAPAPRLTFCSARGMFSDTTTRLYPSSLAYWICGLPFSSSGVVINRTFSRSGEPHSVQGDVLPRQLVVSAAATKASQVGRQGVGDQGALTRVSGLVASSLM